jgi:hypothetical protein
MQTKFHYRVHKWQQPVLILSHMNLVYALLSYFFKIHFNIFLFPKWSLFVTFTK